MSTELIVSIPQLRAWAHSHAAGDMKSSQAVTALELFKIADAQAAVMERLVSAVISLKAGTGYPDADCRAMIQDAKELKVRYAGNSQSG